ncbi:MAG: gamma-glutamyltransferase, partial [Deltaproteobacteria bacterium]
AASVLAAGGNAVDGAVAAALACGVVQPAGSGLGGGGFAVIDGPDRGPVVLDFREVAPRAADRDLFVRAEAAGIPDASRTGGLAVAVPAEGIGLATLHGRYGRLPLTRVARPAIRLAARGFPVGEHLAASLEGRGEAGPRLAAALFGPLRSGRALPIPGEVVRRPALARALRAFARTRGEVLRSGWVAEDMVAAARDAGGVLTLEDLVEYEVRDRPPLVGRYRGWTITTMPPPSSGGAVLLQVLGVLEAYDLAALGEGSSAEWHLLAEAMQHAYADRAHFMGDPDRVEVPLDAMLSEERFAAVRAAIDMATTLPAESYGLPVDPGHDAGTQHISVVDDRGLSVALTTTINTAFGAEVVAPRSGIVLNDEMDDFVARPGVPNAYGLVGSEANAVAPGSRPLSSMTPTIMEHPDGRRVVIGASGGPFIISSTLQVILGIVDFGLDPAEAVARPRMHHQWQPKLLFVDDGVPVDVIEGLRARGHRVKPMPFFSAVQVVTRDVDGELLAASDPRKGGWPAGVP